MCGAIGNSFFKKKGINKYTWIRVANGRVIERALMDYLLITKRMVGRLKDVHVFRGVAAGMSDHFLVEAEVVVAKEWGNRVVGCRREVVKVEELKKTEKKQEYQDKLKEAYDRVKEREVGELEEEWGLRGPAGLRRPKFRETSLFLKKLSLSRVAFEKM